MSVGVFLFVCLVDWFNFNGCFLPSHEKKKFTDCCSHYLREITVNDLLLKNSEGEGHPEAEPSAFSCLPLATPKTPALGHLEAERVRSGCP